MSSTSNASSSGSSAANTVVVTARDIEFSNYNRSTNKWGGAVMTMMIMDVATEGLEEYGERVYAVFRNHEDPTDLIEFSSEVDGLDTRVTTADPMVPSAKYELYKIYGATSGEEYATSSEFYFQVPGRLWDFANDTVGQDDITLVSDWFNYGYVEDVNGNKYGFVSTSDVNALAWSGATPSNVSITVDGNSILASDIKKVKITSMFSGDIVCETEYASSSSSYYYAGQTYLMSYMPNLNEIDIVSSGLTGLSKRSSNNTLIQYPYKSLYERTSVCRYYQVNYNYKSYFGYNSGFSRSSGKRFAFPETLERIPDHSLVGTYVSGWYDTHGTYFDSVKFPIYVPDSVREIGSRFLAQVDTKSKLRLPDSVEFLFGGFLSSENFVPYETYKNNFKGEVKIPDVTKAFLANVDRYGNGTTEIARGLVADKISYPQSFSLDVFCNDAGYKNSYYKNLPHNFMLYWRELNNSNSVVTDRNWVAPAQTEKFSTVSDLYGDSFTLNTNGNLKIFDGFNYLKPASGYFDCVIPEGVEELCRDSVTLYNSKTRSVTFPSTLKKIGNGFMSSSQSGSSLSTWSTTTFPSGNTQDIVLDIPEGVTTIGQAFLCKILLNANGFGTQADIVINLPSTITSIGKNFLYDWYQSGDLPVRVLVDCSKISPSVFPSTTPNTDSFTDYYLRYDRVKWTLKINPNYIAQWVEKFPDRLRFPNSNFGNYRRITWDIPGNDYGVILYKEDISDTNTKTVMVSSQSELDSLGYTGSSTGNRSITINGVTLNTSSGQNIITGFVCSPGMTFPDGFMAYCTYFTYICNFSRDKNNPEVIGNDFLRGCTSFNMCIPFEGDAVGDGFLRDCISFNQKIKDYGSMNRLNNVGTDFLRGCTSFNNENGGSIYITPSYVPDNFMLDCTAFTGYCRINIDNPTFYIGDNFMKNCSSSTQCVAFTFSSGVVNGIGNNFLQGCTSYSQTYVPLVSGMQHIVGRIGNNFMQGCTSFAGYFSFPSTQTNVTSVGWGFLNGCWDSSRSSATSYEIGCYPGQDAASEIAKWDNSTSDNPSFATGNATAAGYVDGLRVSAINKNQGTEGRDAFYARFPDINGTGGWYRKTIDAN